MLTDGERIEAERVAERMRERYRHMQADESRRRERIEQAKRRAERERVVDLYAMDEVDE